MASYSTTSSMNTSNLPKRFGLKYSPKPLIALEYEINGPDPGKPTSPQSHFTGRASLHALKMVESTYGYNFFVCLYEYRDFRIWAGPRARV